MAKGRMMDKWDCGICIEPIEGKAHVRIAVDVAVEKNIGGVSSLMDDEVVILGVFHTECVLDTLDDEGLEEDVPYLKGARTLAGALASKGKPPSVKQSALRLRVLNGGVQ